MRRFTAHFDRGLRHRAEGSFQHHPRIANALPSAEPHVLIGAHEQRPVRFHRGNGGPPVLRIGHLGTDPQPLYVMQFLPSGPVAEAPWAGTDPRKHSVSLCYLVSVSTDPVCWTGGEALNFKWFGVDELAGLAQMWPGASHLIDALLARSGLSSS